jgi:hypothetical protein
VRAHLLAATLLGSCATLHRSPNACGWQHATRPATRALPPQWRRGAGIAADTEPAHLTVNVINACARQPLPIASLSLTRSHTLVWQRGANEHGVVEGDIPAGSYSLRVQCIGYELYSDTIVVGGRSRDTLVAALGSARYPLQEVPVETGPPRTVRATGRPWSIQRRLLNER